MYNIVNKSGTLEAYFYNNAILEPHSFNPLGIVLGNCVYGLHAQACGRIFKGHIRAVSGDLLGRLIKNDDLAVSAEVVQHCMQFAWQVIARMQGDGCLWVKDSEIWSRQTLLHTLVNATVPEPVA